MRYVTQFAEYLAVSGRFSYQWAANAIYDPNVTSTGHQPLGHDEWGQFYSENMVVASKINIRFVYDDATVSDTLSIAVGVRDASTLPAATNDAMGTFCEQPKTNWGAMQMIPNGSHSTLTLNNSYDMYDFFKLKRGEVPTSQAANFGANPSNLVYYTVNGQAIGLDATAKGFKMITTIDYVVRMWAPKILSRS